MGQHSAAPRARLRHQLQPSTKTECLGRVTLISFPGFLDQVSCVILNEEQGGPREAQFGFLNQLVRRKLSQIWFRKRKDGMFPLCPKLQRKCKQIACMGTLKKKNQENFLETSSDSYRFLYRGNSSKPKLQEIQGVFRADFLR